MPGFLHLRGLVRLALITALLIPTAHAASAGGFEVWTPLGLDGGRIDELAMASQAGGALYAGTPTGVFKSADGGAHWAAANDELPASSVRALAVEADQPDVVYAGLGLEKGVFKSVDGGQTWQPANAGLVGSPEILLAHPRVRGTLYAAMSAGIFRTVNAGGQWTKLPEFPTTVPFTSVYSLAVDPSSTQTLYVGLGDGLLKTLDGGATWSHIGAQTLGGWHIDALAVHPSSPNTVYAAAFRFAEGTADLFRSIDGGATWMSASLGLPANRRITTLAIPPASPTVLFAGGVGSGVFKSVNGGMQWTAVSEALSASILVPDPAANGTLYAAGTGMGTTGVFKTADGGESWAFSSRGINAFALESLVADPRAASILYAGSSQFGVFKSTDAGQTWKPANQGFPDPGLARITALAIHSPDPRILYAAGFTLHGIGVFRTLDGGEHWAPTGKLLEAVYVLKIDPQDPRIVHAGTDSGIYRSTDSGATWVLTEHPDMYRSSISDIALDPASPAVLYAIAFWAGFPECGPCPKDGLFKSTDRGATWSLLAEGAFTKVAVDPKDPSTLYALEGIRTILKSTDGGHHWSTIARVPEPDPPTLTGLFIDPQVSTTLYLAEGNGVLRSTDGGVTWALWNDGLHSPVTALAFDPSTPAKVLVATREAGISAHLTAGVSSPCIPDSTHLCLNGGRFRVEASWKDFQGNTGLGKTLPLTNDTGAFWFFGPDNLELTVKVLDGRAANGRFWVFYGSLTNVEFTLTVTDTVTQQTRSYRNPAGHFASAGDTSAF